MTAGMTFVFPQNSGARHESVVSAAGMTPIFMAGTVFQETMKPPQDFALRAPLKPF